MNKIIEFAAVFGLHPLVALGVLVVDLMLFGGESISLGVSWPISIPVGIVLAVAVTLFQKSSFGDGWVLAAAKGLLFGLFTAIPTPLPSMLTVVAGLTGAFALKQADKALVNGSQD